MPDSNRKQRESDIRYQRAATARKERAFRRNGHREANRFLLNILPAPLGNLQGRNMPMVGCGTTAVRRLADGPPPKG